MKKLFFSMCAVGAVAVCMIFPGGSGRLMAQTKGADEIIHPKEIPLKLDAELGVPALRIGQSKLHQVDVTLIEIPPGGKIAPHQHLAEEMMLIISGKGYTEMWNGKAGKKVKYEWSEGDMLSPSLNVWHQHFNASSSTPARYLSITTAPLTDNVFKNSAFLNANNFSFDDRWNKSLRKEPQHFGNAKEGPDSVRMIAGHLFPNLRNRDLGDRGEKMLGITIDPEGDMAGNQLFEVEVREFPQPDSTSPEHRHLWETVYYILKGEGYATLQREGQPERRVDWKEGDMFLVEANEYHNHKPRAVGARFLQFKASGYFRRVGIDDYLMQNLPKDK